MKKSRFLTNISLYLWNDTRYGYRTPIETRVRSMNGAIFNDLERPFTLISRTRHYLTLNISETIQDMAILSHYLKLTLSCFPETQCRFQGHDIVRCEITRKWYKRGTMLTGSRLWSIKWCHFKWPWMGPNQISRARHYSTSNISKTILSRVWSIEWFRLQGPWLTLT